MKYFPQTKKSHILLPMQATNSNFANKNAFTANFIGIVCLDIDYDILAQILQGVFQRLPPSARRPFPGGNVAEPPADWQPI